LGGHAVSLQSLRQRDHGRRAIRGDGSFGGVGVVVARAPLRIRRFGNRTVELVTRAGRSG